MKIQSITYRGKKNYSESEVRAAIEGVSSQREALIKLGLPTTGNYGYRTLRVFVEKYGLKIPELDRSTKRAVAKQTIPLRDILNGLHPSFQTSTLRRKLLKEGVFEWKCSECDLTEWRGKPIPIVLDHIDGNNLNHRLENLRFLCRNCDGQTDTFCGKNMKRRNAGE